MAVPYSQSNLKGRFTTGATPSQQDFADLIDTLFYNLNAVNTTATAASTSAAATAALAPVVLGNVSWDGTTVTVNSQKNIASVAQTSSAVTSTSHGYIFRVTFTTPLANTTYKALLGAAPNTNSSYATTVLGVVAQTTTYVDVQVNGTSGAVVQFFLAIFA